MSPARALSKWAPGSQAGPWIVTGRCSSESALCADDSACASPAATADASGSVRPHTGPHSVADLWPRGPSCTARPTLLAGLGHPKIGGARTLRLLFGAARAQSDCPHAVCDPLALVIDVLFRAHRDLEPRDLAAMRVEVDRLAAVLGAHGSHPSPPARSVEASHPAPATAERRAYRRVAASTSCECTAGPLSRGELDHIGVRLEAYLDEGAARPAGCGAPA
jgi:hypothetical protein